MMIRTCLSITAYLAVLVALILTVFASNTLAQRVGNALNGGSCYYATPSGTGD